jgi:hypothetical protein
MKKTYLIIFTILFLLISNNYSDAQVDSTKGQFVDRIRKVLKEKLIEKLEFDEQTADKYVELYYIAADETIKLNEQRMKTFRYLENNPEAEDIDQKVDELIEIDIKIAGLRKDFLLGIKEILTTKQTAQAVVFQNKFNRFLREQINKFKKDRQKTPKRKKGRD